MKERFIQKRIRKKEGKKKRISLVYNRARIPHKRREYFRITDRWCPKGLNGLNGDKFQEVVVGGRGDRWDAESFSKCSSSRIIRDLFDPGRHKSGLGALFP